MAAGIARKENFVPESQQPRRSRISAWVISAFAILIVAIFILSFFLDPIVRARVENTMNQKLVGYHTRLAHAHVQLLNDSLILDGLVVTQNAHPNPPVANLPEMGFHIQWRELLTGHIVADVLLTPRRVHRNRPRWQPRAWRKLE